MDNPDPLDEVAPLAVKAGVWISRRLADRGLTDSVDFLKLFICVCGEPLLMMNVNAEVKSSPEVIAALKEIAPQGYMTFIDSGVCAVCGTAVPESLESQLSFGVDTAGNVRDYERRKISG